MNKKKILIFSLIFATVLVVGFLISTILLRNRQIIPSRATNQGPSCPAPDSGTCTWSSDDSATSFRVVVTDETTGQKLIDTTTQNKQIKFNPVSGHTYKCSVKPVNDCGTGEESTDTTSCLVVTGTPPPTDTPTLTPTFTPTPETSVTPSLTLTPTPTETPTETPTPTPTNTKTPTPTPTLTGTLTPTETPEFSPTPTETPNPSVTVTKTPTVTRTPTSPPGSTNTPPPEDTQFIAETSPVPTIPESGTPANWLFIAVPLVIIFLGLIF